MKAKELWADLEALEQKIDQQYSSFFKDRNSYNFIKPLLEHFEFESDDLDDMWDEIVQNNQECDVPIIRVCPKHRIDSFDIYLIEVTAFGIYGREVNDDNDNDIVEVGFYDVADTWQRISLIDELEKL